MALWFGFWPAAVVAGLLVAAFGGLVERFILRRLAGAELAQVLVTPGLSFMIADVCLMVWTGDPIRIDTPPGLRGATAIGGLGFPTYRLAVSVVAVVFAAALWALLDRTRRGGRRADGARGRHPRLAALHGRVLPGRMAGRLRRCHRRADPLRLSRPR